MEYTKRYISDIIEGEINNMPDEEIDRDIKRFEKINKKLGVKDAICITNGEIRNNEFEEIENLKFAKMYRVKFNEKEIQFIAETLNGQTYIYVNEEDADRLIMTLYYDDID